MSVDESSHDHVLLVGAGVVGRAIAVDHIRAGLPVWLADRDEEILRSSCDLVLQACDSIADSASPWGSKIPLPIVRLRPRHLHDYRDDLLIARAAAPRWLLIESIAERLEIKQAFFAEAEKWFDHPAALTTNTSTLSIASIAASMQSPQRLCGLHFFMPVVDRNVAEVIPHSGTVPSVIEAVSSHANLLGKTPLTVRDSPGFVVNRLLAPYLNLAMDLLCGGVSAETIHRAALRMGMPMSPLELVDLIGARTAFDGGRIVWAAFPSRMDPSPLLPAMIKAKRPGVAVGEGFYHYDHAGKRISDSLAPNSERLLQKYQHDDFSALPTRDPQRTNLVAELFAGTVRLEAIAIERDGVADRSAITTAMRGGLGWRGATTNAGPHDLVSEERAHQLAALFPKLKCIQSI